MEPVHVHPRTEQERERARFKCVPQPNSSQIVQQQVSRGEYEVNSQRVAVAILERIGVIQSRDPVRGRGSGHDLLGELNVPREV